jgi:hypothetical protein
MSVQKAKGMQAPGAQITREVGTQSVAVASGGNLSSPFNMSDFAMLGILTPSGLAGSIVYFQASAIEASSGFRDLYDDNGTRISISTAPNRAIGVASNAGPLAPWQFVRLVFGPTGSLNNQPDAMALTILAKG